MTPNAKAMIKADEGLKLRAYPDPVSELAVSGGGSGEPWTIGYGHTGPEVHAGLQWTQQEADAAFEKDFAHAVALLDAHIPWWRQMCDVRQDVLASMCFNLGFGDGSHGLSSFHNTLKKMQAADYAGAADGMLVSHWAVQVRARASRLALMMRTGISQ